MAEIEFHLYNSAVAEFLAGEGGIVMEELDKVADCVLSSAQRLAPVRTGRLRDSLKKVRDSDGILVGTDTVPYAIFQELGTMRMKAQPYLRPSLDEVY